MTKIRKAIMKKISLETVGSATKGSARFLKRISLNGIDTFQFHHFFKRPVILRFIDIFLDGEKGQSESI